MLNFFKKNKEGQWCSQQGNFRIVITHNKKYSWKLIHRDDIIYRGSGVNGLVEACNYACDSFKG